MSKPDYDIIQVKDDESLKACVQCINKGFISVARKFNLTIKSAPNNGVFLNFGKYKSEVCKGMDVYAIFEGETVLATVGLKWLPQNTVEVLRLAVLPNFKGQGLGKMLMGFVEDITYKKMTRDPHIESFTIQLGCIAEDEVLIGFYENLGYSVQAVKTFKKLPHDVCFMRKTVNL